MTVEGWRVVSDVVGHVIWPLVVVVLILAFRPQLGAFIAEVEEAGWGGATVKRGNRRSKELKKSSDPRSVDDIDPLGEATPSDREPSGGAPAPAQKFLSYYGRTAVDRLRSSKYNTRTTSARLGAEIVGNSYADLKQAIRLAAFVTRGSGGTRGVIPSTERSLELLGLPSDLERDILDARQFADDVTEKRLRVDGDGASDYIDSVRALVARLINWSVNQPAGGMGAS